MGNAKIWFRPEGSRVGLKIDLGRRVQSRAGPYLQYKGNYSEAIGGLSVTVIHSGRSDIRIQLTWERRGTNGTDDGSQLRRKLWDLQAHLKRGGYCTFVEDEDYAWAAFTERPIEHKATQLSVHYPPITNLIASGKSPSGREIYTASDFDTYLTEMRLCTGYGNHYLTVDRRYLEDYSRVRWVLVREAGTYPAMRVPPPLRSQNFLDAGNEQVFRLDLPLEEDPERLEELALTRGQIVDETERPEAIDPPIDFDDPYGGVGHPHFDSYRF